MLFKEKTCTNKNTCSQLLFELSSTQAEMNDDILNIAQTADSAFILVT